ncbi:hypothetical protein [Streptomyces sp. NPDC057877]|uniref:hypothetical protein n=1 Tax=Streptomyces sp. NPDC057877 TaxID=3346269 RepID=UPI0036B4E814
MPHPGRSPLSTARHAGRLLCWSLAAGMLTAATDLLLAPSPAWWHTAWPLPWYAACASAVTWAVLRSREKRAAADRPPEWERAA